MPSACWWSAPTTTACVATATSEPATTTRGRPRLYEDVGIFTCDPAVGDDVTQLFNHLTGYSRAHDYVSLLVAPRDMRGQLIDLIEHEASLGAEGRITAKLNSLGDPELVEALYEASQAGRADRSRRPRHLLPPCRRARAQREHPRPLDPRVATSSTRASSASRHGDNGAPLFLVGSADWMPRNLDRRIEVLVPVIHPKHQAWLDRVFEFDFADDIVRWEMDAEGSWQRRGPNAVHRGRRPGALLPLGGRPAEAVIRRALACRSPVVHLRSGLRHLRSLLSQSVVPSGQGVRKLEPQSSCYRLWPCRPRPR